MATEPKCNHVFSFPREGGGTIRFIHDLPLTLKHHYPLPAIGTSEIPLFQGEFSVDCKTYKGGLALRLGPRPSLWFAGEHEQHIEELIGIFSLGAAHWMDDRVLSLDVGDDVPQPPGQITVARSNRSGTSWTEDQIDAAEVGSPDDLDEWTFFILNGWQAMDGATTCHEGREHTGRLDAATDNWAIRIDPRGDVTQKAARKHMNTTAGHTVTHIGRLRREDKGSDRPVDALSAVVSMRNDVAHPERNNAQSWTNHQWGETGFVALHMLDLALLYWIGYQGRYIPRTAEYRAADESIRVPWASAGS